jgi:hypothetical protein
LHITPTQDQQGAQLEHRVLAVVVGHAGAGHRAVERGREQHRATGQRLARGAHALYRHQREVAAGGVADDHQAAGRDAFGQQSPVRAVAVVGRGGKRMLGRQPVVGDQRACLEAAAQACGQRGVRVGEAEGERAAVQVQDDAALAALRDRDPLGGNAAAIGRGARDVGRDPEIARVDLL